MAQGNCTELTARINGETYKSRKTAYPEQGETLHNLG